MRASAQQLGGACMGGRRGGKREGRPEGAFECWLCGCCWFWVIGGAGAVACIGCGQVYGGGEVRSGPVSEGVHEGVACAAKGEVRRGRPLIEERGLTLTATEPWKGLGMSRRTWERRRKAEREGG